MKILPYNRDAAVAYAETWALSRNPAYYSFSGIGGDCTNFASQCLFAGSGVMNHTPVTGWYYYNPSSRTASWTGVPFLYQFLTGNQGVGPFGKTVSREEILPGDFVQLGRSDGSFYHTPVVVQVSDGKIYVAAHTNDTLHRPLSTYSYNQIRYIHIEGIRSY